MARRVFLTGGSGFVGSAMIDELLNRGWAVRALANRRAVRRADAVELVRGELFDAAALAEGLAGCEAVIHLVGIIAEQPGRGVTFERIHAEGTRAVVDATRRAGVRRYVHMSALGTRPGAVSRYHRTKHEAEEHVRASGLDWTILRPSMIHGPGGDFMRMEAAWARGRAAPFLFMPYFGAGTAGRGGAGKLQPVDVRDVARAFVDALEKPATVGKTYPLAGAQVVTWPEMHRAVAEAVTGRRRRWVMPLPAWWAKALTRVAPAKLLPFNREQVEMSQEDNTAEMGEFVRDFGWTPAAFEERLKAFAADL
jgi:NADH dehydrogenase